MVCNDTIVAQATPSGRGGIGILRVSGPKAQEIAEKVLGKLPKPRYAEYLNFKDLNGIILDQGIALWFPGPNSFTGEDVVELQCHGGTVVLDLLLRCILKLSEVRIANPGEFSKRAFINNKIDLVQAEAIADLINANSEQAARSALKTLQGKFSVHINKLVESLTYLRTIVEATIDFPEEGEEIDFLSEKKLRTQIDGMIKDLDKICNKSRQGIFLQEGIKVVISGCPNSGKSSLMNKLTGYKSAIVTNVAGTTRDVLREYIYIDGIPVNIIDTAGLRNTNDEVERIGIELAWQEIEQADHVLFVLDSTIVNTINQIEIWSKFITRLPSKTPITLVFNKIDITGETPGISYINNYPAIRLSAHTGKGVKELLTYLKKGKEFNIGTEGIFIARRRHLQSLKAAIQHLKKSKSQLDNRCFNELLAEELRLAQKNLGEITGEIRSDDLLGRIFSSFCIGK